jgi:hypothetical protein
MTALLVTGGGVLTAGFFVGGDVVVRGFGVDEVVFLGVVETGGLGGGVLGTGAVVAEAASSSRPPVPAPAPASGGAAATGGT